ncbi:hypothetical protein [Staphylococcus devriesei]|uniref:hypothetical protein n=1 Tax=Staphylococcus devriesei TaxID=586733 RepID=UPI0026759301|nr:hypothetical protein [Staphylococcus devriesei]WKU12439.1 hypothetical protein Q2T90_06500 [Staphylococcus devriesei]
MTFINYQLKNFVRSYKYIAPLATFFIILVVIYFYSNQPVLSSFASTSMILLFISAWLTSIIVNLDSIEEKHLLFTQLKSKNAYLTGKLLFTCLILLPIVFCAILYPIITMRFEYWPSLSEILIGLYLHLVITIVGIILTTLINSIPTLSNKFIWLLIVLIFLISILKVTIIQAIPVLKFILWIFPPISELLMLLNQSSNKIFDSAFLITNVWLIIYITIATTTLYYIFNKIEYHS